MAGWGGGPGAAAHPTHPPAALAILSSVCQQVLSASSCPGCAFFMSTSSARIFSPTAAARQGPGKARSSQQAAAHAGAAPLAPGGPHSQRLCSPEAAGGQASRAGKDCWESNRHGTRRALPPSHLPQA